MPRFDGTGPMGRGPLTGRGMGYCAVRLPPSGAEAEPSMGRPEASRSGGLFYPYRGLICSQRLQFAPGLPPIGRLRGRGSRHGRTLQRGSAPFGR
jgi:hypothetical protein